MNQLSPAPRRINTMQKLIRASALSVAMIAAMVAATPADIPHFALSKSTPEADATGASPSEIRLWFTEEPAEGTTSIRLVEAEEAGVHVMDVEQDPNDARSFFVTIHGTLPAGVYTVSWRGMGDDGHVVRDTFAFTVAAQ
jgi:methionine-rich copper-binding protein CopC